MIKTKLILISIILPVLLFSQQEFSQGPYGNGYFDIAGPFTVTDLNGVVTGDINSDDIVNIQDIILVIGRILGTIELNEIQQTLADINNDDLIDILDIVLLVDSIMNPVQANWDFESNWAGTDSYIFIHYQTNTSGSTGLWSSTTRQTLLENSPNNVHYFFLSSRTMSESDVSQMKSHFDIILAEFSEEDQAHWESHLHFVPERSLSMDNWLATTLNGNYAIAIDPFQRIRQIGYMGNPASFSGTYIHYLAHEAVYFNYELGVFSDSGENYEEIIIFDEHIYSGGWASTTSQLVELPDDNQLLNYDKMEVELLRGCPSSEGGYDDEACDDYDRIAHLYLCQGQCYENIIHYSLDESNCIEGGYSWDTENGLCYEINYLDDISQEDCSEEFWNYNRQCEEIARWITPFDRQPHHLTDISPFISHLRPGGTKMIKYQESGWPNSKITLKLRLFDGSTNLSPKSYQTMWTGTKQFNPNYDDNRPPFVFNVPEDASKVEFVAYITGHGWGSAGCYNCAEFCNSKHNFEVNGGMLNFDIAYPNASSSNYCMQLSTIAQGVVPNQYGTWGYGRAGWCPGQDVKPFVTDITDYVIMGDENIMDYTACRVSGANCVEPPVCQGDGYCPEIAFTSYIIFY